MNLIYIFVIFFLLAVIAVLVFTISRFRNPEEKKAAVDASRMQSIARELECDLLTAEERLQLAKEKAQQLEKYDNL